MNFEQLQSMLTVTTTLNVTAIASATGLRSYRGGDEQVLKGVLYWWGSDGCPRKRCFRTWADNSGPRIALKADAKSCYTLRVWGSFATTRGDCQ